MCEQARAAHLSRNAWAGPPACGMTAVTRRLCQAAPRVGRQKAPWLERLGSGELSSGDACWRYGEKRACALVLPKHLMRLWDTSSERLPQTKV